MNRAQEEALVGTIIVLLYVIICGSVGVLLVYTKGVRLIPLLMFTSTAILAGPVLWLLPFVLKKLGRRRKKIYTDERDLQISKNAAFVAQTVLWFYFVGACLVAWWRVGPEGNVSVHVMPLVLVGGLAIFTLVQSVTAFVQYGRGGENGRE